MEECEMSRIRYDALPLLSQYPCDQSVNELPSVADAGLWPFEPTVLEKVIDEQRERLGACYRASQERDRDSGGRVRVKIVVARDGRVKSIVPTCVTMLDAELVRCVVAAFAAIKFPKPITDADATVVAPITMLPRD
jgi:outer membrane biosynthesis protein TonB